MFYNMHLWLWEAKLLLAAFIERPNDWWSIIDNSWRLGLSVQVIALVKLAKKMDNLVDRRALL